MRYFIKLLIAFTFLIGSTGAFGQGKIKGYMFGDYYYVLKNHDRSIEESNGFWFRRIYFTYDHKISDEFSTRFRLEMNSPGDFSSRSKLEPAVKDAYLKWKRTNHALILGISGTPTWGYIENFWGYRAVEKTAADLYKFDSSRDFGVALQGTTSDKKMNYHLMFGNGSGTRSENNDGKKVRLSLGYQLTENITVEAYGDWEERPGNTDRYTAQGFASYENENFRAGAQFLHQNRSSNSTDLNLEVLSIFGAAKLSEKVWGFARWDRAFDPLEDDGPEISYLPIDGSAKFNFLLLGIDIMPHKQVHFMPNVEMVFYGDAIGANPDSDVIPRFSFYYLWK